MINHSHNQQTTQKTSKNYALGGGVVVAGWRPSYQWNFHYTDLDDLKYIYIEREKKIREKFILYYDY